MGVLIQARYVRRSWKVRMEWKRKWKWVGYIAIAMDVEVPRCWYGDSAHVTTALVDPRCGGSMKSSESQGTVALDPRGTRPRNTSVEEYLLYRALNIVLCTKDL
ncbi:jg16217 [Pararge aegeria aegeria]|uniref:Jg16217 protein n=1 Tax=Pararge aegeria aegeria TaxID=348720 RepID=A0A8S4RWD0_9NEOP|nr:jg16217 [Pararge aegeria aegeria]